jgi:hypothetical protein
MAKGGQPHQKSTGSKTVPVETTLAEKGIAKKRSARAQKLAKIPVAKLEEIAGKLGLMSRRGFIWFRRLAGV